MFCKASGKFPGDIGIFLFAVSVKCNVKVTALGFTVGYGSLVVTFFMVMFMSKLISKDGSVHLVNAWLLSTSNILWHLLVNVCSVNSSLKEK